MPDEIFPLTGEPRFCEHCFPPHVTTDYYITDLGVECRDAYELRIARESRRDPTPRRPEDKAT
jgi:hypothetical protein